MLYHYFIHDIYITDSPSKQGLGHPDSFNVRNWVIEFLKVICHAKGDILLGPGGTMTTLSEKGERFNI